MNKSKAIVFLSTVTISASIFATDYTLSGSTSAGRTLEGSDTATISASTVYGGTTANTDDDIITISGTGGVTVTVDGVFHGGEDLINTTSATTGVTINIGANGKLIATENGLSNAYDAIDLNGDGSGYVATNAVVTNAGTIWVADKHAIQANDSVGATITNTGTMSARDDTIEARDTNSLTITNSGTISADNGSITYNGGGSDLTEAKNSTTDNTAAISFYGDDSSATLSSGVYYSDGLTLTNQSGGTITADYTTVELYGGSSTKKSKNITITNSGTISSTKASGGITDGAIYAEAVNGFTLINSGTISVANRAAINLDDATGSISLTNSGVISAGGTDGIRATSAADFNLTNSGTITANSEAVRIADAASVNINNTGTIQATLDYAIDAIDTDNSVITNYGTISARDETVWIGSTNSDTGSTLTNYGTIKASSSSNDAIRLYNNNTVILGEGSVVIGDIELESNTATGNTIKFDVGSARSYVYTITDSASQGWTLTDLDGRSAIQGSAKAAGVGNVEIADEALFNRTNAINNSLARYARVGNNNRTWADLYLSATARDEDGTTAKYQQNLLGATIVEPQTANSRMVVCLQRANLDISDIIQEVDATSISVGLHKDNVYQGATGRAMLTYNDYDSSQEVLDNTSSTGYTNYTGDYDSLGLTLGLNKVHNHGDVTVTLDGEIAHERIDGYAETATFTWKDRNLTQATLSATGEWNKNVNGKDVFVNAGVTARGLISGKKANYTIDSTDTSFDGGNQSEVIATFGAGVDYNLANDAAARFEVQGGYSNRKTTLASIATTLDWKF